MFQNLFAFIASNSDVKDIINDGLYENLEDPCSWLSGAESLGLTMQEIRTLLSAATTLTVWSPLKLSRLCSHTQSANTIYF